MTPARSRLEPQRGRSSMPSSCSEADRRPCGRCDLRRPHGSGPSRWPSSGPAEQAQHSARRRVPSRAPTPDFAQRLRGPTALRRCQVSAPKAPPAAPRFPATPRSNDDATLRVREAVPGAHSPTRRAAPHRSVRGPICQVATSLPPRNGHRHHAYPTFPCNRSIALVSRRAIMRRGRVNPSIRR